MDGKLPLTARIVLLIVSFLLLYCASLYENQSRKLVSALEVLWIKVDELRLQGMKRRLALLSAGTEGVIWFCDRLFGKSLFSVRAFAVALVLPIIQALAYLDYVLVPLLPSKAVVVSFTTLCVFMAPICCFLFGATGRISTSALLILLLLEALVLRLLWPPMPITGNPSLDAPLLMSAVLGLAVIAANRAVLRWCAATRSADRALAVTAVNLLMIMAIMMAPGWYGRSLEPTIKTLEKVDDEYVLLSIPDALEVLPPPPADPSEPIRARQDREAKLKLLEPAALAARRQLYRYGVLRIFFRGMVLLELSFLLIAFAPVLVFGALIIHRLLWPVLGRLLYPLSQYGVLESRRTMATIGLSLLILAVGPGNFAKILAAFK